MHKFLSYVSGISGISLTGFALVVKDVPVGLQGIGAITVSILLYQMSDMRQRLTRIEDLLIRGEREHKAHSKSAGK